MEKNDVYSELVDVLGREAADRFVDYYRGSSVYVPHSINTKQTYEKIREEFRNGASYRELRIKYGYAERHIRRIIHKRKKEG